MSEQWIHPAGVLPLIPPALVSRAIKGLPHASYESPYPLTAEVEVPGRGRAAIEFTIERVRRHIYDWVAVRAEPVGPFLLPPDPPGGCFTCRHFVSYDYAYIAAVCGRIPRRKLWRQSRPARGCFSHDREPGTDDDLDQLLGQYGIKLRADEEKT